jgi:hypothetical protein
MENSPYILEQWEAKRVYDELVKRYSPVYSQDSDLQNRINKELSVMSGTYSPTF